MTEFQTYLADKKIDAEKFKKNEPEVYAEYETQFMQLHPNSFTAQKLFVINKIRRNYTLEEKPETETATKKPAAKPKMMARPRPKPKTS
ncbi:MAG: hypothetical protein ABJG41_06350 [Cyclobacteriaceae bacterium]